MIVIEIALLVIALSISLFALSLSLSFFFGPPFVTTPKKLVREMIELAKIDSTDLVIDLGSGDGRVLIETAKICKHAIGIEINPFLVILSKIYAVKENLSDKIRVVFQNYKNVKLSSGTVIFLYNIRSSLPEIEIKLKNELRPGTRIISYKFELSEFKLVKNTKSGLFLYRVKK